MTPLDLTSGLFLGCAPRPAPVLRVGRLELGGGRRSALFSFDDRYRYRLCIPIGGPLQTRVLFVMLNPSTATETHDDPTIRRCIGYARRWGYHWCGIVNLFALRSTDPKALLHDADPIGPGNDGSIARAASEADLVVAAWGAHKAIGQRAREVLPLLGSDVRCLAVTKAGHPAHPLYQRSDAKPVPYALPGGTL